jgi:Chaperone for flagella basal body P-ring formation
MRIWGIVAVVATAVSVAQAACGDAGGVRDRGLHRAWRVQRNCAHPERPAVLVEVPWTAPVVRGRGEHAMALKPVPLVRAGGRVTMTWQDENSDGHLSGTALTTASAGQTVAVRTGLGAAILHGVVRGPGWVELATRKVGP